VSRFNQRRGEVQERAAERRRREEAAPRLAERVPKLESLKLEVQELRAGAAIPESTHVRRIPVPHAAALFDLPCLDSFCKDGGHDVTQQILRHLERGETKFEGEDACRGQTGNAGCQRVLRYTAFATYLP
jgi:hypothetical protein